MAFKMKGDPFKRVATKSMKNSAYDMKDSAYKQVSDDQADKMSKRQGAKKGSSDPFKQSVADDAWGIGGEKRRKEERYNPDSGDLRHMIQSAGLTLSRYKDEAERSGKMSDWKKYNEQLAKFKDFDTFFSDYSSSLDDATVRDSRQLKEGDIADLENYMKHTTERYEPYSTPTFDAHMDLDTQYQEAKKNKDRDALMELEPKMRKHMAIMEAMKQGISPEEFRRQQQMKNQPSQVAGDMKSAEEKI